MEGDRLKVYLTSPPVDGQANRALLKFLAKTLKTPPSSLRLAQGAASREKLILFEGLSQDELARRLGLALGGDAGKAKT
jgi:uncharacterized protein (TIGR00251 family)